MKRMPLHRCNDFATPQPIGVTDSEIATRCVVTTSQIACSTNNGSRNTVPTDPHVASTTSISLFRRLGAKDGDRVLLRKGNQRVVIPLKLIDVEDGKAWVDHDENDLIEISPLTAANLGFGWLCDIAGEKEERDGRRTGVHRMDGCGVIDDDTACHNLGKDRRRRSSAQCYIQLHRLEPTEASRVMLRPLGSPHDDDHDDAAVATSDAAARRPSGSQVEDDDSWALPCRGRLIQKTPSHMISVYSSSGNRIFFYEVLQCEPPPTSVSEQSQSRSESKDQTHLSIPLYIVTKYTSIELDLSPLPKSQRVLRLPPLRSLQTYCESMTHATTAPAAQKPNRHRHNQNSLPLSVSSSPSPYPNHEQIVSRLMFHSGNAPRDCVFHVLGSQSQHGAAHCIQLAAHAAGMRCITVRSLCTFALRHHQGDYTPTTGALRDQLNGLEIVLDYIRKKRMEPCVLHLQEFDHQLEWCGDEQEREDAEGRFWSVITEALASYGMPPVTDMQSVTNKAGRGAAISNKLHAPPKCSTCHPLTVILSTVRPLQNGPMLQGMSQPSISLDAPGMDYIKFVWGTNAVHSDDFYRKCVGKNVDDLAWIRRRFGLLREETKGKSSTLRHQRNSDSANSQDASEDDAIAVLDDCIRELQSRRRAATSASSKVSNVRWDDIGGMLEVRQQIRDIIDLPLQHPRLFPPMKSSAGILLYGPPGTGKTLVAKAVATECKLPFVSVKGPELLGSYVGETESNIRAIFASAHRTAIQNACKAAILFFDELDSLAPKRGFAGDGGGVMDRVVAALFTEIDKERKDQCIIIMIGATNRPDLLDPGLLRRMNRMVYLGVVDDINKRASVLQAQLRKLTLDEDAAEVAKQVATRAPANFTGADFSAVVSAALSVAIQRVCCKAESDASQANIPVQDVISSWPREARSPVVTAADLIQSLDQVTPSVSDDDMRRYDSLRKKFSIAQPKGHHTAEFHREE